MSEHPLRDLPPRGKTPNSKRTLDAWIDQAARRTGVINKRLGWLVASSVVVAALQRARDHDGHPRFLLKGGAYLESKLGLRARATADVDLLFRDNFDDLLDALDLALAEPWGTLELQRTSIDVIEGAHRLTKPRRFSVKLLIRGSTWRSIKVEVSADEADAGRHHDELPPPDLEHFGLPSPVELAGIAMDYQVAQKLHACTDPHDPPERINDRVRDLTDLLLIREELYRDAGDLGELRQPCTHLFAARAAEAEQLGEPARQWPPTVTAYDPWHADWERLTNELGRNQPLEQAVEELNQWIAEIDAATQQ